MCGLPIFALRDFVVVVMAESFDGSWVGSMSLGVSAFEDLLHGLDKCFSEVVRGKSPPGL